MYPPVCCVILFLPTCSAFKKQQFRWAKGSIQVAMKLIPTIVSHPSLAWSLKLESVIHLCAYIVHPMMVLYMFLTCMLFLINPPGSNYLVVVFTAVIAAGPPGVVAMAQLELGQPQRLVLMPLILILFHSLCISNAIAVWEAITGIKSEFVRTPKFGSSKTGVAKASTSTQAWKAEKNWESSDYAKDLMTHLPLSELVCFLVIVTVMFAGLFLEVCEMTYPWLFFFAIGFAYLLFLHYQEWASMTAARMASSSTTPSTAGKALKEN